jgi:hypothetical protein
VASKIELVRQADVGLSAGIMLDAAIAFLRAGRRADAAQILEYVADDMGPCGFADLLRSAARDALLLVHQ